MNRTIQLTKKPVASVGPRKIKIVEKLANLGGNRKPVEVIELQKACRRTLTPKVFRSHLRDLRDLKVVSIRRVA